MKFNNSQPIYIQIVNNIKKQIASKEIDQEEKLLSVRELSSKLKVNPNTIQKAYAKLEREDLVYTKRGMGTFVTKNNEIILKLKTDMSKDIVNSYITDMKAIGFSKKEIIEIINKQLEKE